MVCMLLVFRSNASEKVMGAIQHYSSQTDCDVWQRFITTWVYSDNPYPHIYSINVKKVRSHMPILSKLLHVFQPWAQPMLSETSARDADASRRAVTWCGELIYVQLYVRTHPLLIWLRTHHQWKIGESVSWEHSNVRDRTGQCHPTSLPYNEHVKGKNMWAVLWMFPTRWALPIPVEYIICVEHGRF